MSNHPIFNFFNITWVDQEQDNPFFCDEDLADMSYRHTLYLDEYELMEATCHFNEGGSHKDYLLIWNIPFSDQDIINRVKETRVVFACAMDLWLEILSLHACGQDKSRIKSYLRGLLESWSYAIVEDDDPFYNDDEELYCPIDSVNLDKE
jgi:hypothetical protein